MSFLPTCLEKALTYKKEAQQIFCCVIHNIILNMIFNLIVWLTVLFLVLAVTVPCLLCQLLKRSFEIVQMKQTSPFGIRGILLKGAAEIWGLQHIILFIGSIHLGFSGRFKLKITVQNIQFFCTRNIASLVPVDLIEGFQEANILYNFLNFCLSKNKTSVKSMSSTPKSHSNRTQAKMSTFEYLSKGVAHLFILLAMHIIQIKLQDFKIFVVSSFPDELADISDKKRKKESLMLMQCLAEYTLNCDQISISCTIDHHQKYKLNFYCNQIICSSFQHWKTPFFQINQITLQITIPFSLSIQHSYNQLNFKLIVNNSIINLVPSNFDHFFQLIKELSFDPSLNSSQKSNMQSNSMHQIEMNLDLITINFEDIYESDYDNKQAKQYLSNINSAIATLQKFMLDGSGFSIKMSTLAVAKYCRQQTLSRLLQVLKIPNLKIKNVSQSLVTEISHDEVILNCFSEQIALFGKIFSLVNTRIRYQNYNQQIYRQVQIKHCEGATIISEMHEMLQEKGRRQSLKQQLAVQKKHKLVYTPKRLTFSLEMINLRHNLSIEGFTYTRQHGINEMSHIIIMDQLVVEFKQLKEFIVNDFKLTYSLTTVQDQLTISIKDITMNQNQATLTDYLDSYTLLKHLLQFQSDEGQKVTKFAKKNVSIQHILLSLAQEKVQLKSLQLAKESHIKDILDHIYFTVQSCSISLSKLRPKKKLMRPFVNSNATIFSFTSLSVTKSFQLRHNRPKEKIAVVLKQPCLNLPQVNIASRVVSYMQMFSRMDSHIQAYLRNVSNQKVKSQKFVIKETLWEPPSLQLTIVNCRLSIADTKIEHAILSFSRTVRQELGVHYGKRVYNEAEILNVLRRNNKDKCALAQITIQKIRLLVNQIPNMLPQQPHILAYASKFQQDNQTQTYQSLRIKRAKAGQCEVKIKRFELKVRDYPQKILQISDLGLQGNLLVVKRIFSGKQYFLKGTVSIGTLKANIGLSQLSGLIQIKKRLAELKAAQEFAKTLWLEQQQDRIKQTSIHQFLESWRWSIDFNKSAQSEINILAGITPYEQDKFQLELGQWKAHLNCFETSFQLNLIQLKFRDLSVFHVPQLDITLQIKTVQKQFDLEVSSVFSGQVELSLSKELVRYVKELKQLRKDWLLVYGIYEEVITPKKIQLEDIQSMNYLQIADLLLKQKIRKVGSNSLLNFVRHLRLTTSLHSIQVALMEEDLQLALSFTIVEFFNTFRPNHDLYNSFQVIRSKFKVQAVSACFRKKIDGLAEAIVNSRDAQIVSRQHLRRQELYSKIIKFISLKLVTINFNWYFQEEKTVGRANFWISVSQIQGEISKKLQQYCNRIQNIYDSIPRSQQQEGRPKAARPLTKFRKAILAIIAINRRNRIKKGHVKKYKAVANIEKCCFVLKNSNKQLVFHSKHRMLIQQGIQYGQTDYYHAKPQPHISFVLPNSIISVMDGQASTQIMVIDKMKLLLKTGQEQAVSCGWCWLQGVHLKLSVGSKNAVSQLIEFLVKMTHSSALHKQLRRQQAKKYSEFKNNKLEKLAEIIKWKQSDLKYNQHEQFCWQFQLSNLTFQLGQQSRKLISGDFSEISLQINLFNNTKVARKVVVKRFSLWNQLQSEESEYRRIMETDKQGNYFDMLVESYGVQAFSDVVWSYFKEISLGMQPLKIRMTQELVALLVQYFQQPQTTNDEDYNEQQKYRSQTPDYVKLLTVLRMHFQLWFKSSNPLKRMQGITVELEQYQLKDQLCTKSQMGRWWGVWLVRQLAGQVLGILQQKIMGNSREARPLHP